MNEELQTLAIAVGCYAALGVISLLVARKSQIDAWAESKPRLAALLKAMRALGLDPWMLLQALSLLFRKRLPATSRDPSLPLPPTAPPASTTVVKPHMDDKA